MAKKKTKNDMMLFHAQSMRDMLKISKPSFLNQIKEYFSILFFVLSILFTIFVLPILTFGIIVLIALKIIF